MWAFSRRRSSQVEQGLELGRKACRFVLLIVPSPVARDYVVHVAIDLTGSKARAICKLLKKNANGDRLRFRSRESREFRESHESRNRSWGEAPLADLNSCFLIFKACGVGRTVNKSVEFRDVSLNRAQLDQSFRGRTHDRSSVGVQRWLHRER